MHQMTSQWYRIWLSLTPVKLANVARAGEAFHADDNAMMERIHTGTASTHSSNNKLASMSIGRTLALPIQNKRRKRLRATKKKNTFIQNFRCSVNGMVVLAGWQCLFRSAFCSGSNIKQLTSSDRISSNTCWLCMPNVVSGGFIQYVFVSGSKWFG